MIVCRKNNAVDFQLSICYMLTVKNHIYLYFSSITTNISRNKKGNSYSYSRSATQAYIQFWALPLNFNFETYRMKINVSTAWNTEKIYIIIMLSHLWMAMTSVGIADDELRIFSNGSERNSSKLSTFESMRNSELSLAVYLSTNCMRS